MINHVYNLDILIQKFSKDDKVNKTIFSVYDNLFKISDLND